MNLEDLPEVKIPKSPNQRKSTQRKFMKSRLEPSSSKVKLNRNEEEVFKCYICQLGFGYQYMVGHHIKKYHKEVAKPFPCPNCPQYFETSNELKRHLVSEYPDEFKFHKRKSNANGTIPRKNLVVERLTMRCPHCPKKFPYQSKLTKHLVSHSKERPYVCTTCGANYKYLARLKYHQDKQKCQTVLELRAKRNFTCTYCNQSVISQTYLNHHLKIFHGVQPPSRKKSKICLFCGYYANSFYALQQHNHMHTGEKPYECSYCGCRMAKKCNLLKHIRSNCKEARTLGTLKECTERTQSLKIKSRNLPTTVPPPSAHQKETNVIKDDTSSIEDSSSLTTARKQSELPEFDEKDLIRWEDPLLLTQTHNLITCTKGTQTPKIGVRNVPTTILILNVHENNMDRIEDNSSLIENSSAGISKQNQTIISLPLVLKMAPTEVQKDPLLLTPNEDTQPNQTVIKYDQESKYPPGQDNVFILPKNILVDPLADQISDAPGGSTNSKEGGRDLVLDFDRNITDPNTHMDLASFINCSVPDVIPTTVLKMDT